MKIHVCLSTHCYHYHAVSICSMLCIFNILMSKLVSKTIFFATSDGDIFCRMTCSGPCLRMGLVVEHSTLILLSHQWQIQLATSRALAYLRCSNKLNYYHFHDESCTHHKHAHQITSIDDSLSLSWAPFEYLQYEASRMCAR